MSVEQQLASAKLLLIRSLIRHFEKRTPAFRDGAKIHGGIKTAGQPTAKADRRGICQQITDPPAKHLFRQISQKMLDIVSGNGIISVTGNIPFVDALVLAMSRARKINNKLTW